MASEPPDAEPERRPVAVTLPPSLDEWLAERADAAGIDRGELLAQLAATYRAAAEDGDAASELVSAVEGAATDAATERVDDRLGSFRSSLDSQLQAIRKRVVQLKRETDEKAEASRLAELSTRVGGLEGSLDDLERSVGSLRADLDALSESVGGTGTSAEGPDRHDGRDGGTDRAAVDAELIERLEDLESKLVRVARAVVELRDGAAAGGNGGVADAEELRGRTLRELKRTALRQGVREADCGDCGGDVGLALLPDATCPHCGARFRGLAVEPATVAPRLDVEGDDEADAGGTDAGATDPSGEAAREEGPRGRSGANAGADGDVEAPPGEDGR